MPSTAPTSTLPETLLQLVRGGTADVALAGDPTDLLALADLHGVTAIVRDRLLGKGDIDESLQAELRGEAAQAAATHLRALADLDTAAGALEGRGVRWLVMKGPANAELLWERPELREYTDLDLLVAPADLGAALEALEAVGFTVLEHNWTMLWERRRGQVHLSGPHTTLVDLHWDVVGEGDIRDKLRIDTVSMIDHADQRRIGRTPVRVLDDIDRLVHLGVHGSLSGGHRLIWLKDIEAAATTSGLRWDAVTERARDFAVAPLLWLMLIRTNAVLTPASVPLDAVHALRPSPPWRWTVHLTDRRGHPVPLRDASLRKTVGRSTRSTSRDSIGELVRSGSSWVGARIRRDPPNDLTDPENPGSMQFVSGGAEGRDRFVQWVAAQERNDR